MKVIAVLNQKGGSGKTTIATHLARALQLDGASVLLVDSDPQGSARDWAAVQDDNPVTVVGIDRPTIDRDLKAIGHKDFVVIDGAPQAADLAVSAIKAASFILIPVQPSPYDIWASEEVVKLIEEARIYKENLKATFVVNRKIANTAIGRDVGEALAAYSVPALDVGVTQRVVFAEAAAQGKSVHEIDKDGPAANEIEAVRVALEEFAK